MNARQVVRGGRLVMGMALVATIMVSGAAAQPLVREATGADVAAIQATVDAFRADLGNPNNANAAGTQAGGRREINWDGGGAGAAAGIFANPMTTFSNRGAVFVSPGTGHEISGQPLPEFGEVNPTYPGQFTAFSAPRLFSPINSNVTDVHFFVPGTTNVPAAVTGFGAVFTDVELATITKMEFYAPDGALLFERWVPASAANASLSFLGVSFPYGEVVGHVRIVAGNTTFGPDEAAGLDVVAMDDFLYSEPVSTTTLIVSPESGQLFRAAPLTIVLGVKASAGLALVSGRVKLDGGDVTQAFAGCMRPGSIVGGGSTLRCALPAGVIPSGDHVFQVEVDLSNGTRLRTAVRWTVIANTEP